MAVRIALAGDTMLGRGVGEALADLHPEDLVAPEVADVMRAADRCVLNLECCISTGGEPWDDPAKPFFFRAPPAAVELLTHLGVDAVTLANNHALDYGPRALHDTLEYLADAGIGWVGAGPDIAAARRPADLGTTDPPVRLVGVTDHPADFAAGRLRPGVAHADLRRGVPSWLGDLVAGDGHALTLVTPHWGPNMVPAPVRHVRAAAEELLASGAALVAGHSAHVFHGVRFAGGDPGPAVLYDLGDFIDDYAVHPELRNDLGVLWLVTLEPDGPSAVEALPLRLDYAHTRVADGADRAEVADRLARACRPFATAVEDTGARLVLSRR